MKAKGQKIALDHKGRDPRVTGFSMSILWNLNAAEATIAALAFPHLSEIPLDGDAAARAANRNMLTAHEWRRLGRGQILELKTNHHEISRGNR